MRHLFNMAFLNVRSLTSHFAHVKSLLLKERYDFFGISESWLSDSISDDMIHISGYSFLRSDRDSRGGGVGLYVRDSLKFEVVNRGNQVCLEQIWIRVKMEKRSYVIGSLYRPPKSRFSDFLDLIENTLSEIFVSCDEIMFGGDLNVNFLDVENRSTQDLVSVVDAFDLIQVISNPTRVTLKTCSLLDVIFVPKSCVNFKSNTKEVSHISDHLLVSCVMDKQEVVSQKIIYLRNFKRLDTDLLNEVLSVTPFSDILYLRDINDKVTYLNSLILLIFDTLAPVKRVLIKKEKPPWLTDTLQTMIYLKDKAFSRFKRSKSASHWTYYKQLRNQVNVAIKMEKRRYLEYHGCGGMGE